jgi:hypothetical protein
MAHRSRTTSTSGNPAFESIVKLTRTFCSQFPDEDFAEICDELVQEASELSDFIARGRPASWAAGTVYAVAWVNLLHTKEAKAGLDAETIASSFDVSVSTVHSKSKALRQTLGLVQLDPSYTLPEMIEENPFVWLLSVNGVMVDIRDAAPDIQEAAYLDGLIPYIPSKNGDAMEGLDTDRFLMDEGSLVDPDGSSQKGAAPQRKRFSMWDVALAGPKWDFDLEPLNQRSSAKRSPRK